MILLNPNIPSADLSEQYLNLKTQIQPCLYSVQVYLPYQYGSIWRPIAERVASNTRVGNPGATELIFKTFPCS